jgi:hypothetical protein
MNNRDDFNNSYFVGFKNLFPTLTNVEFMKYYDEAKYGGYPEEPGGSVWESEGKSIYVLIRILKPKRILEIGNFLGRSGNHILQAVEKNGFGEVVLLDIQERLEYDKLHSQNFERVLDDSLNYLSSTIDFDLIIQDGNHTEKHVKKEIELILENNIKLNYYIWAHDFYKRTSPECSVWIAWVEMREKFKQFESFLDCKSDCGFSIAKK